MKCEVHKEHIVEVNDTIGFLRMDVGTWECRSSIGLLPGLDDGKDVIDVDHALWRRPLLAIEGSDQIAPELAAARLCGGPQRERWQERRTAVALVRKLIINGVTVLTPSDLSEDEARIGIINELHAIGAITVGRVNRQSMVMKDGESDSDQAPLNRRIRDIQTDLFSTMSLEPAHDEAVAVATTTGVAALVLEKWPTLSPREVRKRMVKGGRHVWQATSVETGRWNFWTCAVDPITTRYTPTFEKAIFRFRVLDAPGCLDVDTEIPWFLNMLNCQKAWKITRGQGAVVVVSDQGFHLQHPELVGRIETTAEFGPVSLNAFFQNFHGTDMCRIVLAVAPEAKIMPVLCSARPNRDRNENVASLAENIARSFQFAAEKKADAISASSMESLNDDTNLLAAIRRAVDRGVMVSWFHYPLRYPGVLRPSFTYLQTWRGEKAIGFADRFVTDPPGFHPVEIEAGLSGTAPQAAGIVALVRSVNSKLTPQEIETLIFENSTPIGQGIFIPDAHAIVSAAARTRLDSRP
ncbi:MAG: hypothetical protein IIC02_04285 [Planctomycetes bacterium]|nr:hypothetical protein [Planctomycetota bacterium]